MLVMKNRIAYLFILPLLVLVSCEKYLDKHPISSLTEDIYYKNDKEVEAGVVGTYAALRDVYNFDYVLAGLRSDDSYISDAEGDQNQIDGFNERTTNSYVRAYWTNAYYAIKQANIVLKYLDNVKDANNKLQFEAEARFIRAHMYFNLVRLFGGVPLVTSNIDYTDAAANTRASVADVYSQIIADFQFAADNLRSDRISGEEGRVTKYAAKGMLAKTYLTLKDYPNARTVLQDLINNPGIHKLLPSFKNIFGTANEMNEEIMYAVRFKANSNGLGQTFTYQLDKVTGSAGYRSASDYRGRYVTADSIRKGTTFVLYGTSYYNAGKYLDPGAPKNDAGADFIVLRWADVLLMYAEVVNEMDGTASGPAPAAALAEFNKVRARAMPFVTPYTATSTQVRTQTSFRTTIKAERRLELGVESQRWYDLLRWDDAITVMNAHFTTRNLSVVVEPYQALFPIPQSQIDISRGVLKQNPGY